MTISETQRTMNELTKLIKEQDLEVKVLNFYASKNFYFVCEDGKIVEVGYEAVD